MTCGYTSTMLRWETPSLLNAPNSCWVFRSATSRILTATGTESSPSIPKRTLACPPEPRLARESRREGFFPFFDRQNENLDDTQALRSRKGCFFGRLCYFTWLSGGAGFGKDTHHVCRLVKVIRAAVRDANGFILSYP